MPWTAKTTICRHIILEVLMTFPRCVQVMLSNHPATKASMYVPASGFGE